MENVKKSRIDNSVLLIPLAGVINADNASAVAQKIAAGRSAAAIFWFPCQMICTRCMAIFR